MWSRGEEGGGPGQTKGGGDWFNVPVIVVLDDPDFKVQGGEGGPNKGEFLHCGWKSGTELNP